MNTPTHTAKAVEITRAGAHTANGWCIAANVNIGVRPPLPAGSTMTALSECRLYRRQAASKAAGIETPFMIEFVYRHSGPLQPESTGIYRQPVFLRGPGPGPAETPSTATGAVRGAAVGPDRQMLCATVSLLVQCPTA